MKKSVFCFFVFIFLIILSCSKQSPVELAKNYEMVYNSHDVEKIMSLYAEDIIFKLDDKYIIDREDLCNMASYDSALNVRLEYRDMQTVGDSAVFDVYETNDWLQISGVGEYHYDKCVMTFEDSLVTMIEAKSSKKTLAEVGKVFRALGEWLPDSLSFEMNDLLQSGFSAKSAERWKKILRQWRDDTAGK